MQPKSTDTASRWCRARLRASDRSAVVRRRTTLEITGDDLSVDTMFTDWIRPFHDLLIVALGRAVAVTGLRATMQVTIGADVDLAIYTSLIQPDAHDDTKPLSLREPDAATFVLPDDPAIDFATLLPAWSKLREGAARRGGQLCAPFYVMFIYSEHRYGSVFQSAEALAKARFESRQRPKEEHATRVAAIIDAARGAGVGEADLEWAGNVLRSRNDRPLRELIGELLEQSGVLEEPQRALLAPKMATARAGASHGGADGVYMFPPLLVGAVAPVGCARPPASGAGHTRLGDEQAAGSRNLPSPTRPEGGRRAVDVT